MLIKAFAISTLNLCPLTHHNTHSPHPLSQTHTHTHTYTLKQFLLSGTFVSPSDLDLPKWAAWLAESGYENKEGWNTLMAAVRVRVGSRCCFLCC